MISASAALRVQIETALQPRIPGALTPQPRTLRQLQVTGISELDTLLGGGLPVGAISELVGPLCSGRTTVATAMLAGMTQAGKTVAWVDTTDALDPESAAAAGMDLAKQLWVRCGPRSVPRQRPWTEPADDAGPALLIEGSRTPAPSGGGGSPHPRSEVRGLSDAVDAFLQSDVFARPAPPRDPAIPRRNRLIGTPGAPNRKLLDDLRTDQKATGRRPLDRTPQDPRPFPRRARDREEQIPTDRQPSRRQLLYAQQLAESRQYTSFKADQIANTAAASRQHDDVSAGGAWTDNRHNSAGRSVAAVPNAIAAGLPRFRHLERETSGEGSNSPHPPLAWNPDAEKLHSHARAAASLAGDPPLRPGKATSPFWQVLDQALRTTDLLLAAGGFSAVVLDLGGIPPAFAWRIPLATWFRFRAAADRAQTVLLLLTQHACARSSAEVVLRLSPATAINAGTVLTAAAFHAALDRYRFPSHATFASGPPDEPTLSPSPSPKIHLIRQPDATRHKPPQHDTTWTRSASWAAVATSRFTRGDLR